MSGRRPGPPVYVLGGHQTDFARNVVREGGTLGGLMAEAVAGAVESAGVDPGAIEAGHVGNFAGELYAGQGHLGGLLASAHPALAGLPIARHEAACASGSMAVLAAMAELEAGRCDVALVVGVELMRVGSGFESQAKLGAAALVPDETAGVAYPWPALFDQIAEAYDRRHGLRRGCLAAIAKNNFDCARRNPHAQTRRWTLPERAFDEDDEANPVVVGRMRKHDCSQVSDGAAAVVLASARGAEAFRSRSGREPWGRIAGWGHRTAPMTLAAKLAAASGSPELFPHARGAVTDAFARARVAGADALDVVECHDCFSVTQYLAVELLGVTAPGAAWQAIEDGRTLWGGALPFNPSGGLIGGGHPVGATGVRMLLDAARQVSGRAGATQVEGARRAATLNVGGSLTTTACFVVEAGGA